MKYREIYLDSNVYIAIANREKNHDYVLAKLNNLKKAGFIFPHAPPHAEEISARIKSQRDLPTTLRFINLIKKFNGRSGYLPGYPNERETEEIILELQPHTTSNPELRVVLDIHRTNLKRIRAGELAEDDFQTRIVHEEFYACLARVNSLIDLTDWSKRNDIFHLGRRNEGALKSNFDALRHPTHNIQTFDKIQKENNLGPRRLSNIPPSEIFEDKHFMEFIKRKFSEENIDFLKIPTGFDLIKSHHKRETIITLILNNMERAGYHQEQKNHEATLIGRMHDVTHSIYACRAEYFVTNDERFSRKVAATYMRLRIPTRVINTEEFLTI
ncbi:hypothetical protein U0E23_09415 [Burkholderia stagnalis]|uniref:hypothetical protein n=1 Tax=Burkholderia stagnalis TaxID=1503054 RepID=UPI002AB55908|nr:hypothetical protein [Burkholderia stagnalis]MDY7802686.1 hypothetical protein [Burkholderia stagnalis]